MAYVAFNKLSNGEFSHLPTKIELTNAQRKAWHAEMKSRLFKHAHSFTKTMVVVDLTNEPLEALCEGYKPSRGDIAFVFKMAASKALKGAHKKLVVKAPSSTSPEHGEARDAFMASMGFSWNTKGQRYERDL